MCKTIAVITITAAALLFAAGTAIADDDFAGPQDAQCGFGMAELYDVRVYHPAEFPGYCADTDDVSMAHMVG
ncbi:hypothetical protein [Nonomuraea zeae]|uniref:Secreted protein n=1 Tax=Nonomuraea zeae TaxID=1642303 RepID=A0A5S4G0K5_9ACTN|nr:hypothetical protein [Nonomuraea zeae]TMR26565.1 hypothetical protein ETD85_42170 [Nonomuraea zeae]